jgi:hypothetical protein
MKKIDDSHPNTQILDMKLLKVDISSAGIAPVGKFYNKV